MIFLDDVVLLAFRIGGGLVRREIRWIENEVLVKVREMEDAAVQMLTAEEKKQGKLSDDSEEFLARARSLWQKSKKLPPNYF